MKRFLLILLTCLLWEGSQAQDSVRIAPQPPQVDDILQVLEINDTYVNRFDLSSLLDTHYNVSFYIDEYREGKKRDRLNQMHFGPNIQSIKIFPKEQWEMARKDLGLSPDEDEYVRIKSATSIIRQENDSSAFIYISIPNAGKMGCPVKLYPVGPEEGEKFTMYSTRPFRLDAAPDTATVEIPLVFYGSGWYDERFKITRFCGEKEIDPTLKAELVKDVPHFYVIGMRLEKVKEKSE